MKIAVIFDTPNPGWEDEDFKAEVEAGVPEAEYEVAEALMENGHDDAIAYSYKYPTTDPESRPESAIASSNRSSRQRNRESARGWVSRSSRA